MTQAGLSNWAFYLIVAVTTVLLLVLGRLGSRFVNSVVQRWIPARFGFARTALSVVLMAILYGTTIIVFFTVFGVVAAYFSPCSFHC
ncbi:MAG: hypothetical protein WBB34_20470 [Xanthobacteraceae bacterium]